MSSLSTAIPNAIQPEQGFTLSESKAEEPLYHGDISMSAQGQMNHQDSFSSIDEEIISSATSVEEIICALAKRGCIDLTPLIDLDACGENPCAGGGFCDVYRGKLSDGTRIAIKSLRVYDGHEADTQRKKILKHAARELYHWSKLRHPNVLRLMGLTIFRDRIAMVSEWMENGSLTLFLRLSPDADRILLCMDICAGLCYIHALGMIHGDLKAANIMVSSRGVAMIADFGNSQLKDFTLKFSNTKGFSTSLRWTAPELLNEDESLPPTKEADVYAFGMTVLEVLTGEIPFGTKKERDVILSLLHQKRPPRPTIALDDGVWELVNSCWAGNPAERPSISAVSDSLRALTPDYNLRRSNSRSTHRSGVQDRAARLLSLGKASLRRFQESGKLVDIDQAIKYYDQAMQVTPDDDANRPARLDLFGKSYYLRFKNRGELADIDHAIDYYSQSVQLTPDEDVRKSGRIHLLGGSYYLRFKKHGELADIDQAIKCYSQSVQLTLENDVDKSDRLYWLGRLCYLRFKHQGELADIQRSIGYYHQSVQFTPSDDANRPARLYFLGNSHYLHFKHRGELADINQAIKYCSRAVRLTPDGDADKPDRLHLLGMSHFLRFKHRGDHTDIDEAINYYSQSVCLTPDDDAGKLDQLYWLGMSHYLRFQHQDKLADIDQAINYYTQSVQLTPVDDANRPSRLDLLGNSHYLRYKHCSGLADIDRAIDYYSQSVRLTPENDVGKPRRLYLLGMSHHLRFDQRGEIADIDQAIESYGQSVQLTPDTDADKPERLHWLKESRICRSRHLGRAVAIDQEVASKVQALTLTPDGSERQNRGPGT